MIVVLDNLRSALNVGSIIRTCDAFGISEIYFCGITPGTDSPKVQKTSLGAEKTIKSTYFPTTKEAVLALKNNGKVIVGLETGPTAINITTFETSKNLALVVGNEVNGIAPEVQNECDILLEIPMLGVKESLNVSVAFGIAAFWLQK